MDCWVKIYIHVIGLCDQAKQIGKSGALKREWWGAGCDYYEILRWYPSSMSIKERAILVPIDKFSFVLTTCQILWGLINRIA
jgi:hypothetical protein